MKFLPLLLANLRRKKVRTVLTIGSFVVALFLFGLLGAVRAGFRQGVDIAGADRLIVIGRTGVIQPLPLPYMERIRRLPGVKDVVHSTWFGGVYQDPKNFFSQFVVEPEAWRGMYPEFRVPDEQWRDFVADPTFLLCDEPTGDLDRRSADEILDLLGLLVSERKTTILMVTHDPRAAERAHVVLHLDKGVLIEGSEGRGGR